MPLIRLSETVRVSTTDDNLLDDDFMLGAKDYKLLEADVFENTDARVAVERTDDQDGTTPDINNNINDFSSANNHFTFRDNE